MTDLALLHTTLRPTWARWCEHASPHTARARRSDLAAWGRWLGIPSPELAALATITIEPAELAARLAAWRADQLAARRAPSSVARRLSTIASWLAACARDGVIAARVLAIERPRVDPYASRRATPPWPAVVAAIDLARCEGRTRDAALLLLLGPCALRRSEVAALDLSDYSAAGLRVTRKGGAVAVLDLPPVVREALDAWIVDRGTWPGPLLTSASPTHRGGYRLTPHGIAHVVAEAGLGTPHGLRHAAAREAQHRGASVYDLQALLGHRRVATTEVYAGALVDRFRFVAADLCGADHVSL